MKEIFSGIKNLPKHALTALKNIWRNGVMSFSSIFAVAISVLLVGAVGLVALNIDGITTSIENSIDVYVQLELDLDEDSTQAIETKINAIEGVSKYTYSSPDQELDKLIENFKSGEKLFDSFREDSPVGGAFYVEVDNPEVIHKVTNDIEKIVGVNTATYGGDSSDDMIKALGLVQTGGSVAIVALLIIAFFMIFNTIKVTIIARKTEISIMRMVGASNTYIRIPFMLEGLFIGLIGSILPIFIVVYGYITLFQASGGSFVSQMMPLMNPFPFVIDYAFGLFVIGGLVGLVASMFSISKFLKF